MTVVEEFIGILISVPIKETATITMICDDALGSSLDARKFADEFISRRQCELSGETYKPSQDGWTSVSHQQPKKEPKSDNGFALVGKKGKKVKK